MSQEPPQLPDLGPLKPIRLVGEGERGQVFLAQLPKQSGVIAVKIFKPELARDETAVQRFLDVAKKVTQIRHPHVAKLIEARRLDEERVVVAMEFQEGRDLAEQFAESEILDPDEVTRIGRQVCEGLAAAHEAGVLHLDLKPENVFLCGEQGEIGQVRILDFGVGLLRAEIAEGAPHPPYWPLEQVAGEPGDARSDLYSVGAILYRALSGAPPPADPPRAIPRPAGRPEVPAELEEVILGCLATDPEVRPAGAAEVVRVLAALDSPGAEVPEASVSMLAEPETATGTAPASTTGAARRTPVRVCPKCGRQFPPNVDFCAKDGTQLGAATIPESEGDPLVGTTIGAYYISRLIGAGGMGKVYLAEHIMLGRKVAMKMLLPRYSTSEQAVKRFFHEARAVNRIDHENIIQITDFVEAIGGHNYYIMEFLDGESLHSATQNRGRFTPAQAVHITNQVCDALARTHEAGIIHRDLKPENIFLLDKGPRGDFVKLLDFGIAKLVDASGQAMGVTKTGMVMGTPEFMAPEQATGNKQIDQRADIYSVGVILYVMLTGKVPFEAASLGQLLIKQMTQTPKPPSQAEGVEYEIPEALDAAVLCCLSQDADGRFADMHELQGALLAAVPEAAPLPPEAYSFSEATRTKIITKEIAVARSPRRGVIPLVIALAALLAVLGFGAYYFVWGDAAPDRAPPPPPDPVVTPPAPVVEPALPAPAPPIPTTVQIGFDSEPAGAAVRRPGVKTPLGTTPFTATLERSDSTLTVTFSLIGYESLDKDVDLSKDMHLSVQLGKKKKRGPGKRPPSAGEGYERDGTLDPFGE